MFFALLIAGASALAADEAATPEPGAIVEMANDLVQRASESKLANDPYWRTLLHYKPSILYGYESLIDDPSFFFAKDGKRNPSAELAETIRAFFSPAVAGAKHPIERFPARYAWLRDRLGLSDSDFPVDGEAAFQRFKEGIKPGKVFLVFPAGYLESPASIFGHTFLLIEAEGGDRLLSHSVNYAAITDDKPGLVFGLKGLFGLYKGYYTFLPYYQKIRQYNDIDMRDMWEYELELSPEEKDRFLMATMEMQQVYSSYYYVTENCSYNILFLLEAARPETRITDALGPIVEPIDAVKTAVRLGFASTPSYRPSNYTKIEDLASLLSAEENAYVVDLCLGRRLATDFPFAAESEERQKLIWDCAADYIKYLNVKGKIPEADYRGRFFAILTARSRLGASKAGSSPAVPGQPQDSLGSRKLSLSTGLDEKGLYSDLGFRLTAHEPLERDAGYARDSSLVFGRADLRWRYDAKALELRSLDLVDILSLSISDRYFLRPASEFLSGLEMNGNASGGEDLAFRVKASTGLSGALAPWLQPYLLAGPDLFISPAYPHAVDLLLGGEAGAIATIGPFKGRISADVRRGFFDQVHTRLAFSAEGCLTLGSSFSLDGRYSRAGDYGRWRDEAGLVLSYYF